MKYWRLVGHYDGETQAFSACAGSLQTSPYTPDETARLVGLRAIPSGEAATSLVRGVQFRLTCTTFTPNTIHAMVVSNGIQTAPLVPSPSLDYEVNQPVVAGVPVTIEAKNDVATAVTVAVFLMGCFDNGK
jgi:hypothetical protein